MVCRLVALYKRPGVRHVGIGETLCQSIAKAAGVQAKTACGSLQLCVGIETSIEGEIHAMAQRRRERNALDPGGGADEDLTDDRTAAAGGA